MIEDRELDALVVRYRRLRRFLRATGLGIIAVSVALAAWFWWSHGPAVPTDIPVRPAAAVKDGEWLVLEGYRLDCAKEKRLERWGPFAPGRQGETPILVSYTLFRCEEAPPRLTVKAVALTSWQRQQLQRVGLMTETQDVQVLLRDDLGRETQDKWYYPLGLGLFGVVILLSTWRRESWMRPF